ncbi:MAG: hypothetical protein P8010_24365 [Desulfosarcinaceae bacterium]|jgi:hypothetical protein
MEYQAQRLQVVLGEENQAPRSQWRFTEIYEALLNSPDLIEPELVELGRLVAKRLAACQQRRRAATALEEAALPGYRAFNLQ